MKIKTFTIPIYDGEAATNELNRFLASHRVVTVDREFVPNGTYSAWTICVTVEDGAPGKSSGKSKERVDYREILSPEDFALYSELRDLRKTLAEQDGVPAYALFTNEQLAEIARKRIVSRASLEKVNGVGETRVEKYGERFITVVQRRLNGQGLEPNRSTADETK